MTPREDTIEKQLIAQIEEAFRLILPPLFCKVLNYYDDENEKIVLDKLGHFYPILAKAMGAAIFNAISSSIRGIKFEGCLGLTTVGSPTTQQVVPTMPQNKISGKFFSLKNAQYQGLPVTPNFIKIDVE